MAPISSGSAREGVAHAALTEMIFIITGACLITTSSRREYALSYLDCGCRPPEQRLPDVEAQRTSCSRASARLCDLIKDKELIAQGNKA